MNNVDAPVFRTPPPQTVDGLNLAEMLELAASMIACGPTKALRAAANLSGIDFGTQQMEDFVVWGLGEL